MGMNAPLDALGIQTDRRQLEIKELPVFLQSFYDLEGMSIAGVPCLFVHIKNRGIEIMAIERHLDLLSKIYDLPAVLVCERITLQERNALLRHSIPFIVSGKQMFLPFMATFLTSKCDAEEQCEIVMDGAAQLVFLYHVYQGAHRTYAQDIQRELNCSAMTVSRAIHLLNQMGLIGIQKEGKKGFICSTSIGKDLFMNALPFLLNPVKRTIYIDKSVSHEGLLLSSYSALSHLSFINDSRTPFFADSHLLKWKGNGTSALLSACDQVAIELWRYDPKKLAKGSCVDPLSLYLSLRDVGDERVEQALDFLLEKVWIKINERSNTKI